MRSPVRDSVDWLMRPVRLRPNQTRRWSRDKFPSWRISGYEHEIAQSQGIGTDQVHLNRQKIPVTAADMDDRFDGRSRLTSSARALEPFVRWHKSIGYIGYIDPIFIQNFAPSTDLLASRPLAGPIQLIFQIYCRTLPKGVRSRWNGSRISSVFSSE